MIKRENMEIVPARDEHSAYMKTTFMEFFLDSPINNAVKIDADVQDKELFSMFGKDDFTLVAVDKSNGVVASIIHNHILNPDDIINQKLYIGKRISTET